MHRTKVCRKKKRKAAKRKAFLSKADSGEKGEGLAGPFCIRTWEKLPPSSNKEKRREFSYREQEDRQEKYLRDDS